MCFVNNDDEFSAGCFGIIADAGHRGHTVKKEYNGIECCDARLCSFFPADACISAITYVPDYLYMCHAVSDRNDSCMKWLNPKTSTDSRQVQLWPLGYRAALDELSSSSPGSKSQEGLFCFVRYMNAILNSICNGQYVDGQIPKLFLSRLGLTTGRPLALIPTIPLSVLERVRCWDPKCPLPTVEAPIHAHSAASLHALQNCIESRIIENTDQTEIMDCMVCWHCKEQGR